MDWIVACSLGIWFKRLAYLAILDLLSGPECRMTARKRPQCLETCLHLCISHVNKFSHCCIQTSLSALLHTTHSCHKHSDTQSTTGERVKEEGEERGERQKKKERAAEGDEGEREGKTWSASGETARWECWEEDRCAETVLSVVSDWAGGGWMQEQNLHGWKGMGLWWDEEQTKGRRGGQIHGMREMLAPPALFSKAEQENTNHETKHITEGDFKDLIWFKFKWFLLF